MKQTRFFEKTCKKLLTYALGWNTIISACVEERPCPALKHT